MQIEIQGRDAVAATEELLSIEGIEGSYETLKEVEREGNLATIVHIIEILADTITISDKLYQWYKKYQESLPNSTESRIEKVLIVSPNGDRLLLKNATVEQIQKIMKG